MTARRRSGDSVIVQEAGERWSIDLTGLELPFGYVLVEPGYEEEVLVGLSLDSELETAVDEYFELEPRESAPRRRIAAHPEGSARLAWITFRGGLRSSRARARFARALHR